VLRVRTSDETDNNLISALNAITVVRGVTGRRLPQSDERRNLSLICDQRRRTPTTRSNKSVER